MRSDYVNVTEIRVGDIVAVLSGKDAGKRGKVERLVAPGRLVVEGLNIAKRHTKPRQKMVSGAQTPTVEPGGILEVSAPMYVSKVAVVCPKCDRPVRIKMGRSADGAKVRLCGRCAAQLPGRGVTK